MRRGSEGRESLGWVSVTDELPDPGEEVIVTTARGSVGGATYDGQEWFWESDVDGERPLAVTHWQDLPAPADGHLVVALGICFPKEWTA